MKEISNSAIQLIQQIGTQFQFVFFDRDGVINKLLPGQYVTSTHEFQILPGALEAISKILALTKRTFVVTNQQGIGKKIMSTDQLQTVHDYLQSELSKISEHQFDAMYFAPQLEAQQSKFRKPNIGMALQAQTDFPEVDFGNSLMFGDSRSDYLFAKKAGMKFIRVENMQGWKDEEIPFIRSLQTIIPYL